MIDGCDGIFKLEERERGDLRLHLGTVVEEEVRKWFFVDKI